MNPWTIAAVFLAGIVLGGLYFAGLWWTIHRSTIGRFSQLWVLISFAVRVVVLMAGFYLVAGGRWEKVVAVLAGFLVARTIAISWMRRTTVARQ